MSGLTATHIPQAASATSLSNTACTYTLEGAFNIPQIICPFGGASIAIEPGDNWIFENDGAGNLSTLQPNFISLTDSAGDTAILEAGFGLDLTNVSGNAAILTPNLAGGGTQCLHTDNSGNISGIAEECADTSKVVNSIYSCGSFTTCTGPTQLTLPFMLIGTAALVSGVPSTVTVTISGVSFTSASSYVCTLTDQTTAAGNLLKVVNNSGTSFTITGPASISDTIGYICAGN